MARPTALGICCAVAAFVALGASAVTVGITASWAADNLPSASDMPWWMIVLLATGGVACICAILTIVLELCVPRTGAAVTTCSSGLGVHIGMLVSYTVYLAKYFDLQGYCFMTGCSSSGFASYGSVPSLGTVNAFDYWSSWTTEMKARSIYAWRCCAANKGLGWHTALSSGQCRTAEMTANLIPALPCDAQVVYILGCAIGVLFWLIALPCAIGSVAVAKRRTVAEAHAAAAVMNVDALVAKPAVGPPGQQDQFYATV